MVKETPVRVGFRSGIVGTLESSPFYPEFSDELADYFVSRGLHVTAPPQHKQNTAAAKDSGWVLPIVELLSQVPLGILTAVIADYLLSKKDSRVGSVSVKVITYDKASGKESAALRLEGQPEEVANILRQMEPRDRD